MKTIQYFKLFTYLRDTEELEGIQIFRTINRVRKLPNDFLVEVQRILDGEEPNLEISGVSYEELREKDGMRPIRAILFLDWISKEPEAAFSYMAEGAHRRAPIQPLNNDEKEELAIAIERLKKQVKEQSQSSPEVDMSKNDIVFDEPKVDESKVDSEEVGKEQIDNSNVVDSSLVDNQ